MKKLMIAFLAGSAMIAAVPVIAQAHPDEAYASSDEDWNNGGDTYAQFDQEYQHIWQNIQHGISDGAYTRREAGRFFREMQNIRARAYWDERNGDYDPQLTQARLERLHERLHMAHDRGHERHDAYYGDAYGPYGDRR